MPEKSSQKSFLPCGSTGWVSRARVSDSRLGQSRVVSSPVSQTSPPTNCNPCSVELRTPALKFVLFSLAALYRRRLEVDCTASGGVTPLMLAAMGGHKATLEARVVFASRSVLLPCQCLWPRTAHPQMPRNVNFLRDYLNAARQLVSRMVRSMSHC